MVKATSTLIWNIDHLCLYALQAATADLFPTELLSLADLVTHDHRQLYPQYVGLTTHTIDAVKNSQRYGVCPDYTVAGGAALDLLGAALCLLIRFCFY